MFKKRLHNLHIKLSKRPKLVKLFIKIRNQLNSVINYHITNTINFKNNGENLIVKNVVDEGSVVLDVGANLGQYTENILKIHSNIDITIHLFEPAKNIFEVLKNKFDNNNIYCHNIALSDNIENKVFFEIDNFGETSSFFISQKEKVQANRYSVEVNTIDSFFKELKKIDFLKIDTEGNDFNVLKGAQNSLKAKKIKYIQFEYNYQWLIAGSTLLHAITFLSDLDYKIFLIRPDGLYNFDYNLYGDFFHYANFFAVNESFISNIKHIIKGSF